MRKINLLRSSSLRNSPLHSSPRRSSPRRSSPPCQDILYAIFCVFCKDMVTFQAVLEVRVVRVDLE